MGRLVAYMANRTDRLEAVLSFEQHALRPVRCVEGGAGGIAFYQGDEVLHKKRPLVANSEPDFRELARGVTTDCALLHIREPTVGDFRAENTHPFRYRRYSFAHQGTAQAFAERAGAIRAGLPDFLRRGIRGQTDSETFFFRILAGIHARGLLEAPDVPAHVVLDALREAAEAFRAPTPADGSAEAPSTLTCALTDGRTSYVLCDGAPCSYVERRGPLPPRDVSRHPAPRGRGSRARAAVLRYVLVTTAAETPMNYHAVPQGSVLVVDRDLTTSIHPLSDA